MDKEQYLRSMEAVEPLLYHIAWTMLRMPQDVEDAMQETALRAWEKRQTLRQTDSFRPWTARIMVNVCSSLLHRRNRILTLPEPMQPFSQPHDDDLTLSLHSLPEQYRLPMLLYYVEGMSDREIAAILRLPASTVRGRIYRAKKQLRKELAEQ